ncbi:hypothetical protein MKW98_018512 [Papaver atlanticum]|uniref:RecQ mediated genome instability protein 1 OB-fold domain-containing protein n=1 Tax=Papaver atlanticum TaxID=357466 RepID=A0AAD4TDE7_9MAGN|nr:hypothetical protein MKW98_018512 [Papaver atlanticum]
MSKVARFEDFTHGPPAFSSPKHSRVQGQDYSEEEISCYLGNPSRTTDSSSGEDEDSIRFAFEMKIDIFPWDFVLILKKTWFNSRVSELRKSIRDFGKLNFAQRRSLIFQQFLYCDIKYSSGVGVLPKDADTSSPVNLPGPYVFQVNAIYNLSKSTRMLIMTDGVQYVLGLEHKPIQGFQVVAPVGSKVVIRNVTAKNGLLMLVPEGFQVLGGMVAGLVAESIELVEKVNTLLMDKRKYVLATVAAMKELYVDNSQDVNLPESSIQGTRRTRKASEQGSGISNRAFNRAFNLVRNLISTSVIAPSAFKTLRMRRNTTHLETEMPHTSNRKDVAGLGRKPKIERHTSSNSVIDVAKIIKCNSRMSTGDKKISSRYLPGLCSDSSVKMESRPFIQRKVKVGIHERKVDHTHHPQVFEHSLWGIPTFGNLLRELKRIQDEDGETGDTFDKMSHQMYQDQDSFDVYKKKVEETAASKKILRRELAVAKFKLSRLASALGEKKPYKPARTIKKQLVAINSQLKQLQMLKDARKEEFVGVQSEIQKMRGEIAADLKLTEQPEAPTVNEDDLSVKKLAKFRSQLQGLQIKRDEFRYRKVGAFISTVDGLCSVLGMNGSSVINEVFPGLIGLQSKSSISSETLSKLEKIVVELVKEKTERLEKLQTIAGDLFVLWTLMDTSSEERSLFNNVTRYISATVDEVTIPGALALPLIQKAKGELERLELEASNIKDYPLKMELDPIFFLTRTGSKKALSKQIEHIEEVFASSPSPSSRVSGGSNGTGNSLSLSELLENEDWHIQGTDTTPIGPRERVLMGY